MTPTPPAIQVRNLYYAYPPPFVGAPPTEVLRDVSFAIHAGEFVALLGRVGAGKSTLCLALDGLAPHATGGVFRGAVTVGNLDTRRHSVPVLAQVVGLVFQDPETQLTQMRVEDEIAFGPENLGLPRDEIAERVDWALAAVGLSEHRDRNPAFLSGGEKQRVAIAATLAMRPKVLVLDEPTANLDPEGKAAVFSVLMRLAEEQHIAILLATQDVERVQRYSRRVLVLHEGRVALDGTPETIFEREVKRREWGIGVPQMVELAHLISQRRARTYRFPGVSDAVRVLRRESSIKRSVTHDLPRGAAHLGNLAGSQKAAIQVDQLGHTYEDGIVAVRDVTLAIPPGEFLVLAGPNGSGKTTLAKHFNGLLKPTSGRVLIRGEDTRPLRVAQLARSVGYVFQNPDHQIFAPTVSEEIAFGLRLQGLARHEVDQRVEQALLEGGLAAVADLPPATLSLGQRRLVSLAAVLATMPAILVLDEPTGGLDWQSRKDLIERVLGFNAAGGTVILITHDVRLISEHAARVVILRGGVVVFDGRADALFADRVALAQARLTAPPLVRVAQRLDDLGALPTSLPSIHHAADLADVF